MTPRWVFHHIGVAVSALAPAIAVNEQVFGLRLVSGPFEDPLQNVAVCFLSNRRDEVPLVELVAPLGERSPIASYLARGVGAYHICYEVDDLAETLSYVRARRCIILSGPTPAVAFGGRRIAWVFPPTRQLTEILERPQPADSFTTGQRSDFGAGQSTADNG